MKQGIQNSHLLLPNIQRFGCYFLCIIEAVIRDINNNCSEAVFAIDETDIKMIYNVTIGRNYIDEECFVVDPLSLANYVYWYICRERGYYVGVSLSEISDYRWRVKYLKKPGYGHFVLDYKGEEWDPLDPNRPAKKAYRVDSYRYFI